MIQTILGQKDQVTQKFLENGTRIPVTMVTVTGNVVVQIKNNNKHGYSALQVGIGNRKKANKPLAGHVKASKQTPKYIKEVTVSEEDLTKEDAVKIGDAIKAADVLAVGDIVKVTGHSKGKGFAGGVKRWQFKGGPRTHGQSDRERAPGSIGQTTTPGRVYKGKKMAGKMGNETATILNLEVVNVLDDQLWLKGLVPGIKNSLLIITKTGANKKFTPLYSEPSTEPETQETSSEEQETSVATESTAAPTSAPATEDAPAEEQTAQSEATQIPSDDGHTEEPEHTEEANVEQTNQDEQSTQQDNVTERPSEESKEEEAK